MTGDNETMMQNESWLHTRRYEAPSPDLANRIAMAAMARPQRRPFSLWEWMMGSRTSPIAMRPAYAFAALLVLGIFIGMELPNVASGVTTPTNPTIQAFLYEEEYTL